MVAWHGSNKIQKVSFKYSLMSGWWINEFGSMIIVDIPFVLVERQVWERMQGQLCFSTNDYRIL